MSRWIPWVALATAAGCHEVDVPAPTAEPAPAPVAAKQPEPRADYGASFLFVTQIGAPYLVLSLESPDAWTRGGNRTIPGSWSAVARDVDPRLLPARLAQWQGRTVELHGTDAQTCEATVGAPIVAAQYPGEIELLLPYEDAVTWSDAHSARVHPPVEILQPIWDEGRRLLVAPLYSAGHCDEPVWARPIPTDAPLLHVAKTIPTADNPTLRAVLREPDVVALQATLDQDADEYEQPRVSLQQRAELTGWEDPLGRTTMVSVTIAGPELFTCTGLESRWALAEVQDDAIRRLEQGETSSVRAVFDLERDGTPEVILEGFDAGFEARLLSWTEHGLQLRYELAVPDFTRCPC